ncbi:uncharacterized protein BDZ99DRAFT_375185 [Mytilinidion resinicola]|uniref:Zn(2)-C6 fungal-type domain-containing protein n=1 Tax=Mytilinidion resinicola TaxID=574789 RepID=A0A6A6Z810_9PEZI|nr:uncharacterized protein BDZ99DRAFT_375185 [Mytilinidion resinicola]KAF2817150.1 hypothetical protein BDZ99DRAFT_375185 [Mytilinidion resinicola]
MAGSSRRPHTKSRNGCSECKKRRKKCNEQLPRCSNCEKWNVECDLFMCARQKSANTNTQIRSEGSPSWPSTCSDSSAALSAPIPPPNALNLNMRDLELMNHYSSHTSVTLCQRENWPIWQTQIPREAQLYPFLMHDILALGALHISYLDVSRREVYHLIARSHHDRALESFRSEITEVTPQNAGAIAAFSIVVVMFVSGSAKVTGFNEVTDPILSYIDILAAMRNTGSMIHSCSSVSGGPIGLLLQLIQAIENCGSDPIPVDMDSVLTCLNDVNLSSSDAWEDKGVYQTAIADLRRYVPTQAHDAPPWRHILFWPTQVSAEFFALLREKKAMALIILVHWLVPVQTLQWMWCMDGWGKSILSSLNELLGPEWRPAIEWPLNEMRSASRRHEAFDPSLQ